MRMWINNLCFLNIIFWDINLDRHVKYNKKRRSLDLFVITFSIPILDGIGYDFNRCCTWGMNMKMNTNTSLNMNMNIKININMITACTWTWHEYELKHEHNQEHEYEQEYEHEHKHEHEHEHEYEHDNKFRESFERISQKWTNIFVFGHIFPNWKLNKIDKRSKWKKFKYFIQSIFILFWYNVAYVSPRYLRQKNTLKI